MDHVSSCWESIKQVIDWGKAVATMMQVLSYITQKHPVKIGVGFACQLLLPLPAQAHDQRLHQFIQNMEQLNFLDNVFYCFF